MSLSPQDKLALLMTSAGTMTRAGLLTGLSHQQIGRLLRGENKTAPKPEVIDAIDYAFNLHKQEVKRIAKSHGLPYDPNIPVLAARQPHKKGPKKGELGERVAISHTHWMSDALRNRMIESQQKTGKYYAASVRSMVNLVVYNAAAEKRIKEAIKRERRHRTTSEKVGKLQTQLQLLRGIQREPRYTPLQPMNPTIPSEIIIDNINDALRQRHEPATGDPHTALADQLLLQLTPSTVNKSQNAKPRTTNKGKSRRTR